MWPKNKIVRQLRALHRDLGFFAVGFCLIYAISGILLNHMNGKDPAYNTTEVSLNLEQNLSNEELPVLWADKGLPSLKRIMRIDDSHLRLMLDGGIGVYDARSGKVDYELHSRNEFIYWINKLHYNRVAGWFVAADVFAGLLIFLALSGLFIVSGKHGIGGRGKWYLLAGILIPVIYILLA
jgi:hypothetical protein